MVLVVQNYSLSYGNAADPIRILTDVSLRIGEGEMLGLVGESGSAKSSLANAILRDLPGLVAEESGQISLTGTDLTHASPVQMSALHGRRMSVVFQNAAQALDPVQTLGDHLIETVQCHTGADAKTARSKALTLLDQVGLPDHQRMMAHYPHEVSGGEKQRVVLALALAGDPELILFDEPTSALDATTAATLLDLLRELKDSAGISGLFISHDLGTVADIADRVAVIYGGQIVEEAKPADLFANPVHPYSQALIASLPRPSDSRTGRALSAAQSNAPAPRTGPLPACIYSHLCPHHDTAICDQAPVRLRKVAGRNVSCARAENLSATKPKDSMLSLPAPQDTAVLAAQDINVAFDSSTWLSRKLGRGTPPVLALNGASISLRRGETLGLVGESGCGKSTLARALSGLVPFDGTITLDGEAVSTADDAYRSRVQIIFQNPDSSLNPRHSIATILSRPLKLYRPEFNARQRAEEIKAILARVRLPAAYAQRYPHQLSGGEKQRVAIARALAANPDVIICDEVTSGLDASVQASIVALLRDIQASTQAALVFITHDLAILRHIAHRIAVMYLGDIVETRSTVGLDHGPYHPYTEALLSSSPSIDPHSTTRRVRLTGKLPTRTTRLDGCPFASRCQHKLAGDQCDLHTPPHHEIDQTHRIACYIAPAALAKHTPIWTFEESQT